MTIKKIKKRDGRLVPFNQQKITNAIWKAAEAVGGRDRARAKYLSNKAIQILEKKFNGHTIATVEQIQDLVELVLMKHGHYSTAKAYILYRDLHNKIRDVKSLIDSDELIGNYLDGKDWQIRENSNMAYSLQGLNNHVASEISKRYWLNKLYPKEAREAHLSGDFHIHDMQILAPYCVGWDLHDLLVRGFRGVSGKVASRPAKHFRTALGQLANFFYTLQGESAGANAISSFDTLLAPFIWADKLSYPEVKQAMQEFVYNMNVPTRVGFQTPFTNITLDLQVPRTWKNEVIIIGGAPIGNHKYAEFQKEMDMINRTFAEVMLEGDAEGRVFTFPIPTYSITKDFAWDNPVLEPVWEMTAKYGIPYFSNFINSDMKPEDARSMCLSGEEEILVRKLNPGIKHLTMERLINDYGVSFDREGWGIPKEKLEVLSINPNHFKTEWAEVKRFLKIRGNEVLEIRTKDGKLIKTTKNHPLAVYTAGGLKTKLAKNIKKGDYLLSLKSASSVLNDKFQKIDNLVLTEDLAKILGYFTADGNFLFESRKNLKTYRQPKGLQFTFNFKTKRYFLEVKKLVQSLFKVKTYEKKDPRYNTYYLYIYDTLLARKIYNAGFRKYGRLPDILFNSPKKIIEAFLKYFFAGDGYEKRREIHINDLELARDLVFLYSLIGKPAIFKKRQASQVIYLPEEKNRLKINSLMNNPLIHDRVPGFLINTYLVPGLTKRRMIGIKTLDKYQAKTKETDKIKNSDIYLVQVVEVSQEKKDTEFYDLELAKNHLFVHSLGTVTHNCCRLRLDNRELRKRGGGLFGSNPLTGSIGVVTINMARIGYLAKNEADFFKRLEKLMQIARNSLLTKRQTLERLTEKGLYPYSKYYLSAVKKRFGGYWKNHFNTIGVHGMNEALLNFIGVDIGSPKGKRFTAKVLDFMRKKIAKFQKEDNELYNLEATPAEGTTYRFATLDKKLYPEIKVANEADIKKNGADPFYTNSTQLPVNYTDDVFEALDLQDGLQTRYTGGTVLHFFLGESLADGKLAKTLVRRIAQNYKLPYYTLTPTFSICQSHGYLKGNTPTCPTCGNSCEVFSRVVGYLRPVQQWNPGKQAEFAHRRAFKVQ